MLWMGDNGIKRRPGVTAKNVSSFMDAFGGVAIRQRIDESRCRYAEAQEDSPRLSGSSPVCGDSITATMSTSVSGGSSEKLMT